MALSYKGTLVGGLDGIIADSLIAFNHTNVMYPLVNVRQAPMGAGTVTWPDYTRLASTDAAATTERADVANTAITSAARTATIVEYPIRADISDLAKMASAVDVESDAAVIIGDALAAQFDDTCVSKFTGFSQTAAGAATTITLAHIFDALRQLKAAGAPAPYNLVMSAKGIWGAKGIRPLLVDTAVTGSNAKPHSLLGSKGEEFMSNGFVTSLGSINIFWSNEINDNVASGGDSAAGMFSRDAIGVGVGALGLMRLEEQRDASARLTEYVLTGFWGVKELKDTFGVYILHDVA
jgi:hypothetical protein